MVDDLPLLAVAELRKEPAAKAAAASRPASAAASAPSVWSGKLGELWRSLGEGIWNEARSLLRVTRIDHPEAMLLVPEQTFFVRENLKLRLLNARLALLSRQFDIAQSDLQAAQQTIDRYFDRSSKRTGVASDLIRQVASQARQVEAPGARRNHGCSCGQVPGHLERYRKVSPTLEPAAR